MTNKDLTARSPQFKSSVQKARNLVVRLLFGKRFGQSESGSRVNGGRLADCRRGNASLAIRGKPKPKLSNGLSHTCASYRG